MTQIALGEVIGVDGNTISRYERGAIKPSIKTIQRFADFFGVSVDELINGPTGMEIIVKIKQEKKEVEDLNIEVDMTGKDLVQSVTVAGDRIGIGIVYGGGKTLRDVCDELLRREGLFEKMRADASGKA